MGNTDEKETPANESKLEDAVKENSPPRRPKSARTIKKKNVKFENVAANDNELNSMIPPKKTKSEVGKPTPNAFGSWLEASIPTPKSTITVMKGQIKKQKRSKNTYGKSNNTTKHKSQKNRYSNHNLGKIVKNVTIKKNGRML